MASQGTSEIEEAKLVPSGDREPAAGVPCGSSPDPNVNPRATLETHGDQAMSQYPGPQDNSQSQEGNRALLGLSFPRKLWIIVEDNTFTSVRWNDDGDAVIIEEDLFQREVLSRRGTEKIFETDSLKSFIRLLSLYGFSKIRPNDLSVPHQGNRKVMIYRNSDFQRDKPLLIENIKRKGNLMIIAWPGTSATIPKRKKQVAPTRRSLRVQSKNYNKEAGQRAQNEGPNAHGPSGTRSFIFSDTWFVGNIAGYGTEDPCSSESGGSSAEATFRNFMFAPRATAESDGAGELPTSPPDYGSVMSLYNSCYSILLATHSLIASREAPEDDEEEGSSDYKCAFCEHFGRSPSP